MCSMALKALQVLLDTVGQKASKARPVLLETQIQRMVEILARQAFLALKAALAVLGTQAR